MNNMNMHTNMYMHWCKGVMMLWGKLCIITWAWIWFGWWAWYDWSTWRICLVDTMMLCLSDWICLIDAMVLCYCLVDVTILWYTCCLWIYVCVCVCVCVRWIVGFYAIDECEIYAMLAGTFSGPNPLSLRLLITILLNFDRFNWGKR